MLKAITITLMAIAMSLQEGVCVTDVKRDFKVWTEVWYTVNYLRIR